MLGKARGVKTPMVFEAPEDQENADEGATYARMHAAVHPHRNAHARTDAHICGGGSTLCIPVVSV